MDDVGPRAFSGSGSCVGLVLTQECKCCCSCLLSEWLVGQLSGIGGLNEGRSPKGLSQSGQCKDSLNRQEGNVQRGEQLCLVWVGVRPVQSVEGKRETIGVTYMTHINNIKFYYIFFHPFD